MDKQKTKKVETKKQVSAIEKIDNSSLKKNLIFARNVSEKNESCIGILADDISKIIVQYRNLVKEEGIEEFKKELEEEYGAVNINLEDGTYTEIKQEEATPE